MFNQLTRSIVRSNNLMARAEGLTRVVAYRWEHDGYIQRAFFTRPDAYEHVQWCKTNRQSVRPLYTRDLATGRFVAR